MFFLASDIPRGGISEEGLKIIVTNFPGVSFNMLIHQNVSIGGQGYFVVSFVLKEYQQRGTKAEASLL